MKHKRKRPKLKREFEAERHWCYKKSSKLDYRLKKEFKKKKELKDF